MLSNSGIHGIDLHFHFSCFFVMHLIFMITFCDQGKAAILVYDERTRVDVFPDIELDFTQRVDSSGIGGLLVAANPLHACVNISKPPDMDPTLNWFVLISGTSCNLETKVFNAKLAGYSVAVIYTYRGRVENSSNNHGKNRFYSEMPAVVIKTEDGITLKENYVYTVSMSIRLLIYPNYIFNLMTVLVLFSIVAGLSLVVILAYAAGRLCRARTQQNSCLSSQLLRQLQTRIFKTGDCYETCVICLEDYKDQDQLRILPCSHGYHTKCIDPWLTNNRRSCPVCKRRVILADEHPNDVDSNYEETETTPLLQAQRAGNVNTLIIAVNPNVFPGNRQSI